LERGRGFGKTQVIKTRAQIPTQVTKKTKRAPGVKAKEHQTDQKHQGIISHKSCLVQRGGAGGTSSIDRGVKKEKKKDEEERDSYPADFKEFRGVIEGRRRKQTLGLAGGTKGVSKVDCDTMAKKQAGVMRGDSVPQWGLGGNQEPPAKREMAKRNRQRTFQTEGVWSAQEANIPTLRIGREKVTSGERRRTKQMQK